MTVTTLGAGVYGRALGALGCNLSIPLGQYTTVFKTDIYAILKCVWENFQQQLKSEIV